MNGKRMAAALVALVGVWALSGCGDDPAPGPLDGGDDAGTPGPGPGPDQAARAWCASAASTYCDHLVACGLADESAKLLCGEVMSRDLCGTVEGVALGALTFNAQKAQACLEAIRGLVGQCESSLSSDACGEVVTPAAGVGDRCTEDFDCAVDRTVCLGPQCGSVCLATGALNQPCWNGACHEGLWCDAQARICRAPAALGEACDDASFNSPQCEEGTRCDGTTCVALPGAGDACATGFRHPCAPGNFCYEQALCLPYLELGDSCPNVPSCGPGATCKAGNDGNVCVAREVEGGSCSVNNDCAQDLLCRMGACAPQSEEGEPCTLQGHCVSGLSCDALTRTCERPASVEAGESCTGFTRVCQYDAFCDGVEPGEGTAPGTAGTCTLRTEGSPCSDHYECRALPGYCDGDGTCQPAGDGTPCASTSHCLPGDHCDETGACAPRLPAGSTCSYDVECQSPHRCLGVSPTTGEGTCEMPGGEGAPCLVTDNTECKFPYVCVSGFCTRAMGVGQPCFEGRCVDAACQRARGSSEGTCVPLRKDGDLCDGPYDCESGACFQDLCVPACL